MSREMTILATLVVYKVTLVLIGLWARGRTHNNADFFIAGRHLGPVVASFSYAASSASAWSLLGLSGAAYVMGLSVLWLFAGLIMGHALSWFWVAPRLHRIAHREGLVTLTDFLALEGDARCRRWITWAASGMITFCFLFYVAAQFQAAGNSFAATFDISVTESVVGGGVIILIYTLLGGFWAVSMTDMLQGMLMLLAALVLPVTAFLEVGGWSGFWQGLEGVASPSELSPTGPNTGLMALGFVLGTMSVGLGTVGQPHLLARYMALRDQRSVRIAQRMAVLWFIIVLGNMILLGLCGKILVHQAGNPENLFFILTEQLFPTVIGAIFLAAVLSAIMSTADSQLLVSAAAVAHDIMGEPNEGESRLKISRFVITVLCALAIVVALTLPESIFSRVLFAWNALGSAFGPVVVLRLAGLRLRAQSIVPAMVTGFGLTVYFYLRPDSVGDILERMLPFLLASLMLFVFRVKHTERKTT
ncbi:sodium/proline symporter [Luteithermobacter gelatinilyticus]|uniref:sodium/proline symporter n=1 Tax=Luteithermobacter gelatinilyticus TaxID=2582913 RepID=UPI001106C0BD|nr:sodium/proline symporter [Luteithermobacter gelatinilyticus]